MVSNSAAMAMMRAIIVAFVFVSVSAQVVAQRKYGIMKYYNGSYSNYIGLYMSLSKYLVCIVYAKCIQINTDIHA